MNNQRNPNPLSEPTQLLNDLTQSALALQYDFIAGSSYPIGEKDNLYYLDNTSDYAQSHAKHHEDFRQFLQEFGYYDIFIADPNTGNIVYSVLKELDFATSITSGPYSTTGIADAFTQAIGATDNNQVFFSELSSYLPSYDALAGFLSTPIVENGETIGILIFQIPLDRLNSLLNHQQRWSDAGFGYSGETYLVNPDSTLLTEYRFFLENQRKYLDIIRKTMPAVAEQITMRETSIGTQPVNSLSAKSALAGQTGFKVIKDYRDVEVFSVFTPVMIGNNTYGLIAEIDTDEALAALTTVKSNSISQTAK